MRKVIPIVDQAIIYVKVISTMKIAPMSCEIELRRFGIVPLDCNATYAMDDEREKSRMTKEIDELAILISKMNIWRRVSHSRNMWR